MDGPAATDLPFDARLKTFTSEFLDQRRRKKGRDHGKAFIRPERIDVFPDFRKWFNAIREDRPDVELFEFTSHHDLLLQFVQTKSCHRYKRYSPNDRDCAKPQAGMHYPPTCQRCFVRCLGW